MGAIAVRKIPVLKTLPVPEKEQVKRKKISWSLIFKEIKKKIKNCWFFLRKKIFLNLKNLKRHSKEKETKLSDDYWEKIRKR